MHTCVNKEKDGGAECFCTRMMFTQSLTMYVSISDILIVSPTELLQQ